MMKTLAPLFAVLAITTVGALPASALAQRHDDRYDGRKAQKDKWKNVAIAGGVVGLVGAATHNPTLAAVGAAGAVYGAVRYEDERKNDDHGDRRDDRRRDDRRRNDRDVYGYRQGDDRRSGSSRAMRYGSNDYRDLTRRRDDDRRSEARGYGDARRGEDCRDGRSHG